MSTPNHEFPSGDQPQGSGQSPQMPAGVFTPSGTDALAGSKPTDSVVF